MRKSIEISNKEKVIYLHKDCKFCKHIKVCKYHAKMSELCKSNEFYGMNKYPEWNDSLKAFEIYASCMYFETPFKITDRKASEEICDIPCIIEPVISDFTKGKGCSFNSTKKLVWVGDDPEMSFKELINKYDVEFVTK